MLDCYLRHITDLGHANRGETDVIMTQIRDMSSSATRVGNVARAPGAARGQ
jgi:hypothetical protein